MKPRKGINLFKEALQHMPNCTSKANHPLTKGCILDFAWSIDGALQRAAYRLIGAPHLADSYCGKFRRHVQRCLNNGRTLRQCGSQVRYTSISQWLHDCHAPYRRWELDQPSGVAVAAIRNHSFDWLCHMADQWERREIMYGGRK